jgi:NTE family protein
MSGAWHDRPHEPTVALVLAGGGARGFAHIGVMRALERRGIDIHVFAGTSMGALLGSLFAAGMSADEVHELAREVSWRDVVDLSFGSGLLKSDRLEALLARTLPETFAELTRPLAVTCTDIESGEAVVLMDGDLRSAVLASSSLPGAFEPIDRDGRTLADGGVINNLPVETAGLLGATFTIASDTTAPRRAAYAAPHEGSWWERTVATVRLERRNPMAQMVLRSTDIMVSLLTDMQYVLHPADLRIRLEMPDVVIESFRRLDEIVAQGERTAERALAGGALDGLSGPRRRRGGGRAAVD